MSTNRHDMAVDRRGTLVVQESQEAPRLMLAADRTGQKVLDGGWWPRSWDPATELAGLVVALAERFGPIRQMLLSSAWERRFRRLAVGGSVVRMGWFASMDPALLVAITDGGDQIDLLVVAPATSPAVAEQAMKMAAEPGNLVRAQQILAAALATGVPSVTGAKAKALRDNEGGGARASGKPVGGSRRAA
jgi:hypothetical protein